MSRLAWSNGQYELDGRPFRILSGAIHYFRVVPAYWEDRLRKLQACGFNTVETYVAWNVHEPRRGEFYFEGQADIAGFVKLAGRLGLHVIVRPSPYICAEWEFGGLPAWLLKEEGIRIRCFDPAYLACVDRYYDRLIPQLLPLLSTNGGPVLAVQVENEYGSYGNDTAYLQYLREGLERRGVDVPLFTSDGPTDEMLIGGTIQDVHATVNFGSRTTESFAKFREHRPNEPLMVMEYWNGWFDHWGEPHHVRDAGDVAQVLDEMLEQGASVNMYMFHGGTNFGFYNGANHIHQYEPTVTSYDYDALLTEWGDVTDKFRAVREVLAKHGVAEGGPLPKPIAKFAYGEVVLAERAELFEQLDALSEPVRRTATATMEQLDQNYGFILYSTQLKGPRSLQKLYIREVRDRAQVFVDGRPIGVVERWNDRPLDIAVPAGGVRLDILVENMGRINYGPHLRDPKGITEGVLLDNQYQFNWTIRPLPLEQGDLAKLRYETVEARTMGETTAQDRMAAAGKTSAGGDATAAAEAPDSEPIHEAIGGDTRPRHAKPDESRESLETVHEGTPAFYRGYFDVAEIGDTFLRLDGWCKGTAWINGFHLGRYWAAGPQRALYVPGPLLRPGRNEVVVFELHRAGEGAAVVLTDEPDLGDVAAMDQKALHFVAEDAGNQDA